MVNEVGRKRIITALKAAMDVHHVDVGSFTRLVCADPKLVTDVLAGQADIPQDTAVLWAYKLLIPVARLLPTPDDIGPDVPTVPAPAAPRLRPAPTDPSPLAPTPGPK
jgi:hypothetical protein